MRERITVTKYTKLSIDIAGGRAGSAAEATGGGETEDGRGTVGEKGGRGTVGGFLLIFYLVIALIVVGDNHECSEDEDQHNRKQVGWFLSLSKKSLF